MKTRIHGKHVFECDACGDSLETDTSDWREALQAMRDTDWQARQIGSDWIHTCNACKEPREREGRARRAGIIP